MKTLILNIGLLCTLFAFTSCATRGGYYVKNGQFHPYNGRAVANDKVKIKFKNTYYYFDTVEEAEYFQTRVEKSKKLKNTLNSVTN